MAEPLAIPEQLHIKIVNADEHQSRGRYDEAEELQKAILEEMITSRGLEDRETLWAKARLSQTYLCKGDHGKAEEAQTELLGQCEMHFDWSDPQTHKVASLLITTFHARLDFHKARILVDRRLSHQQKIFQGSSPEILDTQAMLARTTHGQGKFREAAAMRLNLLDQRKARMKTDDPRQLAEALWDHAQSLLTLNKPSEARAPMREDIRTYENLFGPEDSHVLSRRAELAKLRLYEMRFLEVVRVGHEVLKVQERTLGAKHPDTISSMSNQSVYLWHAFLLTHSKSMIDRALALANEHLGRLVPKAGLLRPRQRNGRSEP